jgi:hypothetical protein
LSGVLEWFTSTVLSQSLSRGRRQDVSEHGGHTEILQDKESRVQAHSHGLHPCAFKSSVPHHIGLSIGLLRHHSLLLPQEARLSEEKATIPFMA